MSLTFLLVLRRHPAPTLFPYTTLFRSWKPAAPDPAHSAVRTNDAELDVVHAAGVSGHRRDHTVAILHMHAREECHRVLVQLDRKSTRLNSSHGYISYAVFCLKKKKINA